MPKSIIFVDSRVADYQSLIDSFTEPAELFVLDGASDGLTQIAAYLQGRIGIDAIHVISHGSQGAMYLGSSVLNSSNLASYQAQLASIGGALTETGDTLLYGCNVAQGAEGLQFITSLAQYTGADVAASSDATGAAVLGGDGVLEQVSGSVEAASLLVNHLAGLLEANTAPTFVGSTGKVVTDFGGGSSDSGVSVAIQVDGKILMGGTSDRNGTTDFALVRYNSDGSLDTSFDADGTLTTDFGNNTYDSAGSVALQPDGKILLGGTYGGGNFGLIRYNSNGSLDTTFDTDGRLTTTFSTPSSAQGQGVAIQADGKILLGGNSDGAFVVACYNSDGSLNTNFDGDGKVTTNFSISSTAQAASITLQADGKILIAGYINRSGWCDFALARYNSDGSLDASFDADGKLTTDFGSGSSDNGYSVTVQADGKILLGGSSYRNGTTDFALVRYNSDGSLDTSFDADGMLTTDFGSKTNDSGNSVALQVDGKILLGGYRVNTSSRSHDFALVRYNSDGSLDTSFDVDGKVTTGFGGNSTDYGESVAVQVDGKILLGGYSDGGGSADFALVRYTSDGSLDTTFGQSENTLKESPTYTENYSPIVLDVNVQIRDSELAIAGNYNGASLTLSRHSGASTQDVFSAKSGGTLTALTSGNYFAVNSVTIGRVTNNWLQRVWFSQFRYP